MKTSIILVLIIVTIAILGILLFKNYKNGPIKTVDNNINAVMFVSGRPANSSDVEKGSAVFALKDKKGVIIGKPYPIKIPQTVFIINEENKKREEGTLIQAEIGPNDEIIAGVKLKNGIFKASLMNELELTYPNKL